MSKNDDKIKQLMETISTKRKLLGIRPKVSYHTNGLLNLLNTSVLNINIASENDLIEFISDLKQKEYFHKIACEELNIPVKKFIYNNYAVEDYIDDATARMSVILYDIKRKELDSLEKKLSTLLSEDARTENELNNISKLLES
jgi:hypothetical protein